MILGLINRNFKHVSIPTFVALYKSMVRSHLDYCCPVWSPYRGLNREGTEKSNDIDTCIEQEALLSQRGRAMLRVCIASIQNVERSLLLFVISASDIPLRTNKFFSVVFSSVHAAGRHKQTFDGMRRRLCDLHCLVVGNCFCHFVVRTSSNRSIGSGEWPTPSLYSASSSVNFFGTSHVQQSSIASPAIRP